MVEAASADQDSAGGAFLGAPPPFFSPGYHFRFLPRVIAWRLGQPRHQQHGFHPHAHVEIPLVIFASLFLMAFGLPPALEHGSIGGWLSAVLGAGALSALVAWSVIEERRWRREQDYRYGYAEFMPSVFFFCVLAGGSAGLIAGGTATNDPTMGYVWAAPGLLAGYIAGPFAARWVHAMGFMKSWFIWLAMLGIVLLPIEDLMVLFIYASKPN